MSLERISQPNLCAGELQVCRQAIHRKQTAGGRASAADVPPSAACDASAASAGELPDVAILFARGFERHRAGHLVAAAALYERVLGVQPAHADALHLLGVIALQQRQHTVAARHIRAAIQLRDTEASYHSNMGLVLQALGQADAALVSFEEAIRLQPDYAEAWNNLGRALLFQEAYPRALCSFTEAIRLQPDYAEAWNNRGVALYAQRDLDAAVTTLQRACELRPDYAEAYFNLGNVLRARGDLNQAISLFRQAVAIEPELAAAHNNLGTALLTQGEPEAALVSYREVLRLRPGYAEVYFNIGRALQECGVLDAAATAFDQAIHLRPEYAEAQFGLALVRLAQGDFARGWSGYPARVRLHPELCRAVSQPTWDGTPLGGRTILVYAEQGFGDTLQFVRYLPKVRDQGGTVLFESPPELFSLLQSAPGMDVLAARSAEGKIDLPFDVCISLMSLPAVFGTTLETIPCHVPYLHVPAERAAWWRERLGATAGFRVGIAWAGNPNQRNDHNRSCALTHFAPLADIPGVTLFSLQKGQGVEQLTDVPTVVGLGDALQDFADTAAAIQEMDLIISVDTAVAHLAGALGKPVWTVLCHAPCWRYLRGRPDSPWYPSMCLFRQPRPGDWRSVFTQVERALRRRCSARHSHDT